MNVHTPERLPNESFEAYKARRKASKEAYKASQSIPRRFDNYPTFVGKFNTGVPKLYTHKRFV